VRDPFGTSAKGIPSEYKKRLAMTYGSEWTATHSQFALTLASRLNNLNHFVAPVRKFRKEYEENPYRHGG